MSRLYGCYTEDEIRARYRRDPSKKMIKVLSELCCCGKEEICRIVGISYEPRKKSKSTEVDGSRMYGCYTVDEIRARYKRDPGKETIKVLSELCGCTREEICGIVGLLPEAKSVGKGSRGYREGYHISEEDVTKVREMLADGEPYDIAIDAIYDGSKSILTYTRLLRREMQGMGMYVPKKLDYCPKMSQHQKMTVEAALRFGRSVEDVTEELAGELKCESNVARRAVLNVKYNMERRGEE